MVANDAAGEGINLQRAHLMVNYTSASTEADFLRARFPSAADLAVITWTTVDAEGFDGAALRLREDYGADDLRGFACKVGTCAGPRLMALAAVADGKRRAEAASIGLMDRQTLRDWVVRFDAEGARGSSTRRHPADRRS